MSVDGFGGCADVLKRMARDVDADRWYDVRMELDSIADAHAYGGRARVVSAETYWTAARDIVRSAVARV